MATMDVKDAAGATVAIEKPLAPGRTAAATSRPVALSTEDKAALDAVATQATAAAILAKIVAAPATEAKQDAAITQETAINSVLGVAADAASATTTIKAALRGIATALGVTALDLGSGTGGSRTLRFFKDTAQWVGGAGAVTTATQRVTHASDDPVTTALQIIDDWDETDRAKVNLIVGQAGVAAGNGTVSAATQRVAIADISAGEYETVAASQTAQTIGATGATGDFIGGLLIVPATTAPGNVLLLDNATSITVFAGGAGSVTNLVPFFVPLGMISVSGAWKVTTGANVSVVAIGNFT